MAISDLVRVSLTCRTPDIMIKALECLKKIGKLCGIKNGFSPHHFVESGYRDVKLLLEFSFVDFDVAYFFGESMSSVPLGNGKGEFNMICEIQFLLPQWLEAKKLTGLLYKFRRAKDAKALYLDVKKYLACSQ